MLRVSIILGKVISWISQHLGLGAGATWPGEVALRLKPSILGDLSRGLRQGIILVAGTNGKTTTALMIKTILESQGFSVVHNSSGANLENGLVSALIQKSDWKGTLNQDWGVFEVDENTLPLILKGITPRVVALLNLFRDQLDRYGEVDVIAQKWEEALSRLDRKVSVILNSDDPQIAHLGKQLKTKIRYFGWEDPKDYLPHMEHATDSIFCLNCGGRLSYTGIYFSHIGIWHCEQCGERHPKPQLSRWQSPLPGLYNQYNVLAAVSVAKALKIGDNDITSALATFKPAFGRQEEFMVRGKKIKVFLSKNPAGFNASLRTVLELKPKVALLVLNDRIPDGRDVSWIWDVDFEMITPTVDLIVSGDRVYDMALRLKYIRESQNFLIEEDLNKALYLALEQIKPGDTLYILPTYSAMLEVRKIISGKKIL